MSNDGIDLRPSDWRDAFHEEHHEGSNALHARTEDGGVYLLGPAARIALAGDRAPPAGRRGARGDAVWPARIRRNPYWSIAARAIELIDATAEALDIVDGYRPPARRRSAGRRDPGVAAWATEAPRGLLFHRYEVDERGRIAAAQIVPPTSQNQGAIEADLAAFAPQVLDLPHAEATIRIEQLIRSYDPCISCATHFLDLSIERRLTTDGPLDRVWLVVCGEPERGDDAAGPIAVDGLPAELLDPVRGPPRRRRSTSRRSSTSRPDAACVLVDAADRDPTGCGRRRPARRARPARIAVPVRSGAAIVARAPGRATCSGSSGRCVGGSPAGSFVGIGAASADLGRRRSRRRSTGRMPAFREAIAAEIRRLTTV